jgi:hypothetical protein
MLFRWGSWIDWLPLSLDSVGSLAWRLEVEGVLPIRVFFPRDNGRCGVEPICRSGDVHHLYIFCLRFV